MPAVHRPLVRQPRRLPSAASRGVACSCSGVFWILVTEVCFALMRVATRWGAADLPGWEIGGVRFLGGALVAWGLGRARGVSLRVRDQKNAWLRSIFGTVQRARGVPGAGLEAHRPGRRRHAHRDGAALRGAALGAGARRARAAARAGRGHARLRRGGGARAARRCTSRATWRWRCCWARSPTASPSCGCAGWARARAARPSRSTCRWSPA